jgi:23S rRNA (cytidine2498-2'-O)-methyltransferase
VRAGKLPREQSKTRGDRPEAKRGKLRDGKPGQDRPEAKRGKLRDGRPSQDRPELKRGKFRDGKPGQDRPALKPKFRDGRFDHDEPETKREPTPRPVRVPLSKPRGGLQVGDWLFTTREGSEQDLIDELVLANVVAPPAHVLAPSVVVSPRLPKREHQFIPLTFARQGFQVIANVRHDDWDVLVARLSKAIAGKLGRAEQYALHVWVPDSTDANPLSSTADKLDERVAAILSAELPDATRVDDSLLRRLGSMPFAQICLLEQGHAVAGVGYSNQAISLARGGRTRVRVTGELPSRAARKIEEALAWLGVSPGPGEVCVDLGAAPGGWTYVLSEKRARVIAVDPAKLRPEIAQRRNVEHVPGNAFTYAPKERVDWLFCDMAYRPLEVAAMLARWGRRAWARTLVANIKLPMTKKAEILARVVAILSEEGEWKHVRTRQLYHDRDEITLTAHRGV